MQNDRIIRHNETAGGNGMIRFVLGLFVVFGAVGGLEADTASWTEFFLATALGFTLMFWGLGKILDNEANRG
jgi:choline-glycine betaine transporter